MKNEAKNIVLRFIYEPGRGARGKQNQPFFPGFPVVALIHLNSLLMRAYYT